MELVFKILKSNNKGKGPIEVILKNDKTYKERAISSDKALEALDKILKKSKILNTQKITKINIDNLSKNKYTSYRILKSIKKALKIKSSWLP